MIKDLFIRGITSDKNLTAKNKVKMTGSFIELLEIPSSQSFTIRLGNTIEKCFKDYVLEKGFTIIDESYRGHQADLYFVNKGVKYYFEIKNNINLDTEKTISVVDKVRLFGEVVDFSGCLSFRASNRTELSKFCKPLLVPYVYGYNDFFGLFGDTLSDADFTEIIGVIKRVYLENL